MKIFTLTPGQLSFEDVKQFYFSRPKIQVHSSAQARVDQAHALLHTMLSSGKIMYGVNTGFGKFANTVISGDKLLTLQKKLLLSHAVGVGKPLSREIIHLIYLLKINALSQGFSGVRWELIEQLMAFYHAEICPVVPEQGSVGASGDLAPLAHFSLPLIGLGEIRVQNKVVSTAQWIVNSKLTPYSLYPKEGLALINGLQVSLAIALENAFLAKHIFHAALLSGAMTSVGIGARFCAFDDQIIDLLHSKGASFVAEYLNQWNIDLSEPRSVQDPYSIRCQPQVMGACWDGFHYIEQCLTQAINAVSDNPLFFVKSQQVLSGGNFHGQQIAFASDHLAALLSTISNMTERRIALLMDPQFSHLPAFLVQEGGENSGLMMLQVTAAALASENKLYAHPASADTIPTSGNQEDHVSMATFAANRLSHMVDNLTTIIAIELIASAQALDLANVRENEKIKRWHEMIRANVPFYDSDQSLAQSIKTLAAAVKRGDFCRALT